MSTIPSELKYSREHEWVKLDGDRAFIGITDYAQETLGEIVYIELPETGESVEAGSEIANVESVKAASAIYNPLDGTIDEVNGDLDGSPEALNEDCYGNHIYVLKEFERSQYDALLSAEQYAEYLASLE